MEIIEPGRIPLHHYLGVCGYCKCKFKIHGAEREYEWYRNESVPYFPCPTCSKKVYHLTKLPEA